MLTGPFKGTFEGSPNNEKSIDFKRNLHPQQIGNPISEGPKIGWYKMDMNHFINCKSDLQIGNVILKLDIHVIESTVVCLNRICHVWNGPDPFVINLFGNPQKWDVPLPEDVDSIWNTFICHFLDPPQKCLWGGPWTSIGSYPTRCASLGMECECSPLPCYAKRWILHLAYST